MFANVKQEVDVRASIKDQSGRTIEVFFSLILRSSTVFTIFHHQLYFERSDNTKENF